MLSRWHGERPVSVQRNDERGGCGKPHFAGVSQTQAHRRFWAAFLGVAIGVGSADFDLEHRRGWCWDGPGFGGFGDGRCTQLKEGNVSRRDTGRDALLDPLAMGGIGGLGRSAEGLLCLFC